MSKFVGTGPSSYKKRIYWATVSQRLRTTGLEYALREAQETQEGLELNETNYLLIHAGSLNLVSSNKNTVTKSTRISFEVTQNGNGLNVFW
jgi:hypothetical protein